MPVQPSQPSSVRSRRRVPVVTWVGIVGTALLALIGDAQVTIRWRLDHIVETLQDPRNRVWLGLPATVGGPAAPAESSAAALDALGAAVREFVDAARESGDSAAEPIGAVAGPYGESTRRSFVLHITDELVHHGAEASLLRDLYAAH